MLLNKNMIFQTLCTVQTSPIISSSERFREDNKEEQRYGSAGQVMIHQPGKVMASEGGGKKWEKSTERIENALHGLF